MYINHKSEAKRVAILIAILVAVFAFIAYVTITVCTWAWGVSMDYLHRLFTEATVKEYRIWFVISVSFLSICAYGMKRSFIHDVHNQNFYPGRKDSNFVRRDNTTSRPSRREYEKKVTPVYSNSQNRTVVETAIHNKAVAGYDELEAEYYNKIS